MKFKVLSRLLAQEFKSDTPWVGISITSSGKDWPVLSEENRVGLLQLQFDDLDDRHRHLDKFILFSPEMAESVLRFVSEHLSVPLLMVHCDAGVCRSPGIAAALSRILYNEDDDFFHLFMPNRLVYRTVVQHFVDHPEFNFGELRRILSS